jgi:nitrogen fixation/metabolism regulation signal transduction histidine kinase
MIRWTLSGLTFALMALGAVVAIGSTLALTGLGLGLVTSALVALMITLPVGAIAAHLAMRQTRRVVKALEDGVEGLVAGDFSLRLGVEPGEELGRLAEAYNAIADELARERRDLRQRELLLASVLEASPTAVLLVNAADRILVANRAARLMFADGRQLVGHAFSATIVSAPPEIASLVVEDGERLARVAVDGIEELFQISRRAFDLNARRHVLVLVRRVTPELRRHEVAVWKRVIRVVGHEINNSLAPIRSLVSTGRKLVSDGDDNGRLPDVLDAIDESASRLHRFVDGYRKVSRVPRPATELVDLGGFLDSIRELEAFEPVVDPDLGATRLDPAQLQQVILNLVRNAREAGSSTDEIEVVAGRTGDTLLLEVRDRGPGMDGHTMVEALAPFWTTKPDGSGLGLALCREILDAHGGELHLESRDGGGLVVRCRIPGAVEG